MKVSTVLSKELTSRTILRDVEEVLLDVIACHLAWHRFVSNCYKLVGPPFLSDLWILDDLLLIEIGHQVGHAVLLHKLKPLSLESWSDSLKVHFILRLHRLGSCFLEISTRVLRLQVTLETVCETLRYGGSIWILIIKLVLKFHVSSFRHSLRRDQSWATIFVK